MNPWIVVANASRGRILQAAAAGTGLEQVAAFVHPQSRLPGHALSRYRPGHVEGTGHGLGSAVYQPRTDRRRHEHQVFARELAAALSEGVRHGRCTELILVASDPFLGELCAVLDAATRRVLLRRESADWTTLDDREVARRLGLGRA